MRKLIPSRWGTHLRLKISGDQSRSGVECEIGPPPLEKHGKPIPKTNQKNNVHKQPNQPGRKSTQVDKVQISDCFVASNCGHTSFVPVAESLWFSILDHAQDVARGVTTLLHRDRRHSRQRLSSLMRKIRQITNHLNLRVTGYCEIVVNHHASDSIDRHAERLANE
jgi:hypothetical protein